VSGPHVDVALGQAGDHRSTGAGGPHQYPLAVRVLFSGKLSLKSTRAAAERRSLNAQIIHLLWQAFVVDAEVNASNSPKLRRRLV